MNNNLARHEADGRRALQAENAKLSALLENMGVEFAASTPEGNPALCVGADMRMALSACQARLAEVEAEKHRVGELALKVAAGGSREIVRLECENDALHANLQLAVEALEKHQSYAHIVGGRVCSKYGPHNDEAFLRGEQALAQIRVG